LLWRIRRRAIAIRRPLSPDETSADLKAADQVYRQLGMSARFVGLKGRLIAIAPPTDAP